MIKMINFFDDTKIQRLFRNCKFFRIYFSRKVKIIDKALIINYNNFQKYLNLALKFRIFTLPTTRNGTKARQRTKNECRKIPPTGWQINKKKQAGS